MGGYANDVNAQQLCKWCECTTVGWICKEINRWEKWEWNNE